MAKGASVTIEPSPTGFRRETKTSSRGLYSLTGIPVESYKVLIARTGVNKTQIDPLVLNRLKASVPAGQTQSHHASCVGEVNP